MAIGFDESDVNKTSELENKGKIAIRDNKILLQYYKTISLESGDVNTIFNATVEKSRSDFINYENKYFIGVSHVMLMQKVHNGLKKKLFKNQTVSRLR